MDSLQLCKKMEEIAKGAGKLILNREQIKVSEKEGAANIVTTMDILSQDYILERLQPLIPEAKIIAEESQNNEFDNGYVFIVDPIDATTNYAYDFKHSCISIALVFQNAGYIGVVYNPYLDEMYSAIKGKGFYFNGQRTYMERCDLSHSLIGVGTSPYAKQKADRTFDNMKKLFLAGRDVRRSGSGVLDLCYVACGRYDAFYEASLAPWDYAAGALMIQEAGGIVETLSPDTWGYEKSISIVAGNTDNIEALKNIVK